MYIYSMYVIYCVYMTHLDLFIIIRHLGCFYIFAIVQNAVDGFVLEVGGDAKKCIARLYGSSFLLFGEITIFLGKVFLALPFVFVSNFPPRWVTEPSPIHPNISQLCNTITKTGNFQAMVNCFFSPIPQEQFLPCTKVRKLYPLLEIHRRIFLELLTSPKHRSTPSSHQTWVSLFTLSLSDFIILQEIPISYISK